MIVWVTLNNIFIFAVRHFLFQPKLCKRTFKLYITNECFTSNYLFDNQSRSKCFYKYLSRSKCNTYKYVCMYVLQECSEPLIATLCLKKTDIWRIFRLKIRRDHKIFFLVLRTACMSLYSIEAYRELCILKRNMNHK